MFWFYTSRISWCKGPEAERTGKSKQAWVVSPGDRAGRHAAGGQRPGPGEKAEDGVLLRARDSLGHCRQAVT